MKRQLFFLTHDGWFEAELTGNLLHASGEDLIRWAYATMERYRYRNYRIMEAPLSPSPFMAEWQNGRDREEQMNASFSIHHS